MSDSAYDRVSTALDAFLEDHRLDLLELVKEALPQDFEYKTLNAFDRFAATDNVNRSKEDFSIHCLDLPALIQNPKTAAMGHLVHMLMSELYQECANDMWSNE